MRGDEVRQRIDAHRLLSQLEHGEPSTYIDSLKYETTLRHVDDLLGELRGSANGPYSTDALFDRLERLRQSFVAVDKPRTAAAAAQPVKPPKPAVPVIEPKPFQAPDISTDGAADLIEQDGHDSMIDHGDDHENRADVSSRAGSSLPPPPPFSSSKTAPSNKSASDRVQEPTRGEETPRKRPAPIPVLSQRKPEAASTKSTTVTATAASSGALMDHHASLQSSLLSSLTSMSSQLKFNTVSFSQSLAEDREVMEGAKQKLEVNYDRMKKEGGRLDHVRKKSRGTTCALIGTVAAVAVAWVVMLGLIKIT